MSRHRTFAVEAIFPSGFVNAQEEYLGAYASPNFAVTAASTGVIQVVAGAGDAQVAVAIHGVMRWRTTTTTFTMSGLPNVYDVYVGSGANDQVEEDLGTFNYDFQLFASRQGLSVTPPAGVTIYRKVAEVLWGSEAHPNKILNVTNLLPAPGISLPPVGTLAFIVVPADATAHDYDFGPGASWQPCDGRQLLVADHPVLFNQIGVSYGGGGTNFFNLPDYQSLGALFAPGGGLLVVIRVK